MLRSVLKGLCSFPCLLFSGETGGIDFPRLSRGSMSSNTPLFPDELSTFAFP
uniref:Uncharacterized protein n=1 Tax=Rhizophora mucronata TaxID=61149 RepID=A0A2P2P2X0_RHIMU